MISIFRRLIGSKLGAGLALGFLALIAFAFAAGDVSSTGGFGSLTSFGGGSSTKIGGQSLSESEVQSRVQRVFEQQRRDNPGMQIGQFLEMGAVPQIYDQLVAAMALEEYAHEQGIHVSKRMIDAQIASLPAFQDATGKFSQNLFRQMLASRNISEQALRDDIAQELAGRLLITPAGLGARLSDSMVLPYASLLLEAREGRIAAIPSAAFPPGEKPTDAQLKQFYTRFADRYTVPEQRRLRYAIVDTTRFTAAATPAENEIAKYYADHKDRYAARETRTINQLILPTESAAKAAAGAGSLAQAAKANGLSVATQTQVDKAAFARQSSQAAANAAFAAPQGAIIGPVKLDLGWALMETAAVQKIPETPLDAVRGEIAETLTAEKSQALLSDFTAKVEDEVANGATFDEAVKDNGLKIETTPLLLETGRSVETADYRPPADVTPLLKPAFSMEADDDAQFVAIEPQQRYALLDVTDIVAAAPPPLEKIKNLVTQHYLLHQNAAKAKTLADKLKSEIDKGKPLDKALAEAGVSLPPAQKVAGRRADLLRGDQRPPAEVSILFAMASGTTKIMPIPDDQGYFLIRLDNIQQGDAAEVPGLVDRVRNDMANVAANEYGDQFERAIERELGVKRNAAVVSRVTQELRRINGASVQ